MEFGHLTVIDPPLHRDNGLCNGTEVQHNRSQKLEARGIIRAWHDWSQHLSNSKQQAASLKHNCTLMSVIIPECVPEHLELVSYTVTLASLYATGDIARSPYHIQDRIEGGKVMYQFWEDILGLLQSLHDVEAEVSSDKDFKHQILRKMISLDRECALATINAWKLFIEEFNSASSATFSSMDQYLPYRIIDIGDMFWFGAITFGMGLRIPDTELEVCRRFTAPAWTAISLQNDLYFWIKTSKNTESNGNAINAVSIIMHEHHVDSCQAQEICRQVIQESITKYIQTVKENMDNDHLSRDLRRYLGALQRRISCDVTQISARSRHDSGVCVDCVSRDWSQDGTSVPECFDSNTADFNRLLISECQLSSEIPSTTSTSLGAEPENLCSSSASSVSEAHKECLITQSQQVTEAPFDYVCSLPSKAVREKLIDALNKWFKAPREVVDKVKKVITLLHNASLMLDDFQDDSPLRRGKPSAHAIFGPAQTINSSSHAIVQAILQIQGFSEPECVRLATEKIMVIFQGQALDLHWTYNSICPSVKEYLTMIGGKTGALFELACDLLSSSASGLETNDGLPNTNLLMTLLGQYFQIRDDYQNLVASDYSNQKGFCEDLDEGKYSLPVIHALQKDSQSLRLRNVLSTRRVNGKMTYEQKVFALEQLQACGSLDWTKAILHDMHSKILDEIRVLEARFQQENSNLNALVELLRI